MEKRQVLVVGAGPGGSTAAFYLAKAGIDVLMVDKESWPRDKVCGDGQAATTFPIFQDMGIFDEVWASSNHCAGFNWSGKDEKETFLIADEPWIICTPRRKIDDMTRRAAVDAGADWMENFEAVSFIKERGTVKGVKGYYRGEPMEIRADVTIVAAGSHSMLAREMGCYIEDPDNVFYGARGYFDDVEGMDLNCIEEHYCELLAPSGYMWVFPTGGKKANVGVFVTEKTLEKNNMKIEDYFDWWRDNTRIGKERLSNAHVIGEIKGWRLPCSRGVEKNYIAGAIAIGDSANMIDCWSGGGYLTAMHSGKITAEMLPAILEKGDFSENAMSGIKDAMGFIDMSLKLEASFRDYIFEKPDVAADCLEYMRSLPEYPHILFQDAALRCIKEHLGIQLPDVDLLNGQVLK